ncbi:hypothetical protein Sjap_022440 [Stephania japonica]|uniref:Uncharacterized protein n=1 Tax=Stephania japonica TaxID=461633 RepID=A0AAP0HPW1_9MAGN
MYGRPAITKASTFNFNCLGAVARHFGAEDEENCWDLVMILEFKKPDVYSISIKFRSTIWRTKKNRAASMLDKP